MVFAIALATALDQAVAFSDMGAAKSPLCALPAYGTRIVDPPQVRSHNGSLNITLDMRGLRDPGHQVLCYVFRQRGAHGIEEVDVPPTLRVAQGERIVLTLVDDVARPPSQPALGAGALVVEPATGMPDGMSSGGVDLECGQPQLEPTPTPNPHTGRIYGYHRSPWNETSMHFHGLNTSPLPPGDNVTRVMICPRRSDADPPHSYTYVVDIPRDETPGLYWYHPHAHGESEHQVQLGLTGAIIVDPLAPAPIDQMPNRVIVVRDNALAADVIAPVSLNERLKKVPSPDFADLRRQIASPSFTANDGRKYPYQNPWACAPSARGINVNSKQLSVNEIALPLKARPPALGADDSDAGIEGVPETSIPSGQMQFWRLANTASDTVLNLEMFQGGKVVPIQVVSRDGVPLLNKNGHPTWQAVPMNQVILAPAARVEFYLTGTAPGTRFVLRTMQFDAGCLGDAEFSRDLVAIHVVRPEGHAVVVRAPAAVDPVQTRFSDLAYARPVRHRTFAFTEYPRRDSSEPDFYITQMSDPKAVETPFTMDEKPAVFVKDGTVEDWTLLNYTEEVHAFHIHQIHFLVLDAANMAFGQGQVLDTVVVPYGTFPNGGKRGEQMQPGMVKLRMDFRAKDIVGTFVYHCHLLEHEDNGMMAKIRVLP